MNKNVKYNNKDFKHFGTYLSIINLKGKSQWDNGYENPPLVSKVLGKDNGGYIEF